MINRSTKTKFLMLALVILLILTGCQEDDQVLPPEGYSWWNQVVFHELFVRSFYDSDGDGIGDFLGIQEKTDYLNDKQPTTSDDLSVNGIWLMPIFPSPSYHGYDVTDYQDINPEYGTLDDFKQFLKLAHQRGIKVILDLPLNHTSTEHPWFQKALANDPTYRDYYIWSESDPGYQGPWGQDPWHESPNGDYYYGVFWSGMPDLNYANPAVVEEMNQVLKFWLDMGVDGFRLDGARYIIEEEKEQADTESTHQYYKDLRTYVKGINPEALLLGEVWTDVFTTSTYTKNGDELDLVFNFELAGAYMESARNGTANKVLNALNFNNKLFSMGKAAPFLTNHDMDRVMSELGDEEKAKNAAFMLLTGPGVPFMYYGEEIGMLGKRGSENNDIQRRLPMQWTPGENAGFTTGTPWAPVYPFHGANNVEIQSPDPDSLLSMYRNLIQMRDQHPALLYGETYLIDTNDSAVFATLRSFEDEHLLVLANLSDQPVTDVSLELDKGPLNGSFTPEVIFGSAEFAQLDAIENGGFTQYLPLPTIPEYGRYVVKLNP